MVELEKNGLLAQKLPVQSLDLEKKWGRHRLQVVGLGLQPLPPRQMRFLTKETFNKGGLNLVTQKPDQGNVQQRGTLFRALHWHPPPPSVCPSVFPFLCLFVQYLPTSGCIIILTVKPKTIELLTLK